LRLKRGVDQIPHLFPLRQLILLRQLFLLCQLFPRYQLLHLRLQINLPMKKLLDGLLGATVIKQVEDFFLGQPSIIQPLVQLKLVDFSLVLDQIRLRVKSPRSQMRSLPF
jgi:hypothetical protein